MGVKHLWPILSPHCERKPLSVLRGTTVAIDLAGWICESLNAVDYFVHPKHHLKSLFFRTCQLIMEDVTPVFVLEGNAPKLKIDVIEKRNNVQFRGMAPKAQQHTNEPADFKTEQSNNSGQRKRFKQVLKQCETLLKTLGIDCIQAPGEAEAFCAFLNKKEMVNGVISQDSDCFAYGANRVYRNFTLSMQGSQAAQDGAVDIYDVQKIRETFDFGQKKAIAMALLCGCDYCPSGVDGIGRDGILKLLQKYKDAEILDRIRSWRKDAEKYKALELQAEDKNICINCGHIGSTQSHTKNGCGICRSMRGCIDMPWKEQRLYVKAELALRKKALSSPNFPNEEIINEFLSEPVFTSKISPTWKKPNIANFIKQAVSLLQWTEIYSFQKFFPIVARWHICNDARSKNSSCNIDVTPARIIKKRTIKGVLHIEILWEDRNKIFDKLIPENQLQALSPEELKELWTTKEPYFLVEAAYPALLESFYEQNKKEKRPKVKKQSQKNTLNGNAPTNYLTKDCPSQKKKETIVNKHLQRIEKFFQPKQGMKDENLKQPLKCFPTTSTPQSKYLHFELESDCEIDMNVSDAINDIVKRPLQRELMAYTGRSLQYENVMSATGYENSGKDSKDDMILFTAKKQKCLLKSFSDKSKDDSFDVMVKSIRIV